MARTATPPAAPAPKRPPKSTLTDPQRIMALEQRVAVLESERPGRKPRPLLAIRQRDVCAIDPQSDSSQCEFAGVYRYQSGCHGAACRLKQHQAYERRKHNKAEVVTKKATKAAAVAKKVPAKRPSKTAAPAKKVISKKVVSKRPVVAAA